MTTSPPRSNRTKPPAASFAATLASGSSTTIESSFAKMMLVSSAMETSLTPGHPRYLRQATAFRERAHLLHDLLHLRKLFEQLVHVRHLRARARRDALPPRSIDERRLGPLRLRHRRDDRLDAPQLTLGLRALGQLLRETAHP